MPTALRYRSYAKINTYLDVLPRRSDGFHDIETLFVSVSLFDELRFEPRERDIAFTCNAGNLGPDESNLVVKAARRLQEAEGCSKGVSITLDKRIPVAAGLAGGSGDAAAALVALNALWSLELPKERLLEHALALGSDVPFCLTGGYAAATGRGEILEPLPTPNPPRWFVLVHPEASVSTPDVFNHPALRKNTAARIHGRTGHFAKVVQLASESAQARGQTARADALFFNCMEPVTFDMHPALVTWKGRLVDAGCIASVMSGTGPTLVGLCRDEADAHRVVGTMPDARVSVVREVPAGLERVEDAAA